MGNPNDERDGGPAFPRPKWWPTDGDPDHDGHPQGGMTLRDWLAGQALAAAYAHWSKVLEQDTRNTIDVVPALAYQIADAMLRARREGK